MAFYSLARNHNLNGVSEPQVDMLDIPGKGRCCVFIARFPYDRSADVIKCIRLISL